MNEEILKMVISGLGSILAGLLAIVVKSCLEHYQSPKTRPNQEHIYWQNVNLSLYPSRESLLMETKNKLKSSHHHVITIYGPDKIGKDVFAAHLRKVCFPKHKYFVISAKEYPTVYEWGQRIRGKEWEDRERDWNAFQNEIWRKRYYIIIQHAELLEKQRTEPIERTAKKSESSETTPSTRMYADDIKSLFGKRRTKSRLVLLCNTSCLSKADAEYVEIRPLDETDRQDKNGKILFDDKEWKRCKNICDGYPALWETIRKGRDDHIRDDVWAEVDDGVQRKMRLLSAHERNILYWLALYSPRSTSELERLMNAQTDIHFHDREETILKCLRNLQGQYLIDEVDKQADEKQKAWSIRNTVRKSVRDGMIRTASGAIRGASNDMGSMQRLIVSVRALSGAIRGASNDSNDMESMQRLIVSVRALDDYLLYEGCEIIRPILRELETVNIEATLQEMIELIRKQRQDHYHYAVANILNLMILSGCWHNNPPIKDLYGLDIGQVNFEEVDLRNVNFTGSNLEQAKFGEMLGDTIAKCAAFHPGGKYFVTGCDTGNLVFWDTASARKLSQVHGHRSTIWKVVFFQLKGKANDPDEEYYLATCSDDGSISIWDTRNVTGPDSSGGMKTPPLRMCRLEPEQTSKSVFFAGMDCHYYEAFNSTKASTLLAVGGGSGRIFCYELSEESDRGNIQAVNCNVITATVVNGVSSSSYHCLRFNQDGKYLLAGRRDGRIWAFKIMRPEKDIILEQQGGNWISEPDCLHMALTKPNNNDNQIASMTFEEGSDRLIVGTEDGRLTVWNWLENTGWRLDASTSIRAHRDMVTGAFFLKNASKSERTVLVTCGHDGKVKRWALNENPENLNIPEGFRIHSMAISQDGNKIVTCDDNNTIRMWDVSSDETGTPAELFSITGQSIWINCLAHYTCNGREYLAAGCSNKMVKSWEITEERQLEIQKNWDLENSSSISCMDICQQGGQNGFTLLAVGCKDGSIALWDLEKRKLLYHDQVHHSREVRSIAFLPDSSRERFFHFISASNDKILNVWSFEWKDRDSILMENPWHLKSFHHYLGALDVRRLKKGSNLVAYTSGGKFVQLSHIDEDESAVGIGTEHELVRLEMDDEIDTEYNTQCLRFSPDLKYLVAAVESGHIYFWNIEVLSTENEHVSDTLNIKPIKIPVSKTFVRDVSFDKSSQYVAAVDGEGNLKVALLGDIEKAAELDGAVFKSVNLSRERLYSSLFIEFPKEGKSGKSVIVAGASGKLRICDICDVAEGTETMRDFRLEPHEPCTHLLRYEQMILTDAILPKVRRDTLEAFGASTLEVSGT